MSMRYVHACDIVGYSADSATWCPACAHLIYDRHDPVRGLMNVRHEAYDHDGNLVHPIFADSDDYGTACCDRCGEVLDSWTAER